MPRSFAPRRLAMTFLVLAAPVVAGGCQSSGGWGWPRMAWNPWRSTDSQVASTKPSSIPTPPASMLAGAGAGRPGGSNSGPAGNPYASQNATSPGYKANTSDVATAGNDYGNRQVSATSDYNTGRYSMGGPQSPTQNVPYTSPAPSGMNVTNPYAASSGQPAYGAQNQYGDPGAYATTADRRSDAGFNSGYANPNYNANPGYNSVPAGPSMPAYGAGPTSPATYPATSAPPFNGGAFNGTNPPAANPTATALSSSPYAGQVGVSTGASATASAPNVSLPDGGYRPGSTGRASGAIQPASYDADGYGGAYGTSSGRSTSTTPSYNSDFQP